MICKNASLQDFQDSNKSMYSMTDDRHYTATDLLSYLHRHVTQILKSVRKGKYEKVGYRIAMAFSWAFAIANRLHVRVEDEMWNRFPGVCPYCASSPCACKQRAQNRQVLSQISPAEKPASVAAWQKVFADIYPGNTLRDSAIHLAEEIGELSEALRNFLAFHTDEYFFKITEELVDVFANLLAVANCLQFDLASASAQYFANGCPKCKQPICTCGYVIIDQSL